jgi:hypothetical protein
MNVGLLHYLPFNAYIFLFMTKKSTHSSINTSSLVACLSHYGLFVLTNDLKNVLACLT